MSTNYYIRKKPSKDQIEELKHLIDLSAEGKAFREIKQIICNLYDLPEKWDKDSWGVLHLGLRTGGWKFLWCANLIYINQSYMKDGEFIHMPYKYETRYPLTKQGIRDFVMDDNHVVVDEYGDILDKEEFLEMAFNWNPDGYDSLSYAKATEEDMSISSSSSWSFSKEQEPFKKLGFTFISPRQTDFESDGLRFNIFENFM